MVKRTTNEHGMGRWRRWTENEAREALEELAARGESAVEYAARKGISAQRIGYWKKRLSGRGKTEFVAVALPVAMSRPAIEIAAGKIIVRVREELDVEHVAGLVEAIARRLGGAC